MVENLDIEVWLEDFLNELLDCAGLELWIEEISLDDNENLRVELSGDDAGIAIGREGQGLEALQHIVVSAAIRAGMTQRRIVIDIEGYRIRRETRLQQEAERIAEDALQSGQPQDLHPMNARERRLVHLAISKIDGVVTESLGEGMDRFVRVVPVHG